MNTVTTMNTAVKTASVSLVVDNTKPLTMSSRQIAEFTDKKHSNVMRDIREMYESLGIIDQLKTEFVERINNLGYAVKEPVYHLDEEMTLTLVTGCCKRLCRKRINYVIFPDRRVYRKET
ncbi:Rha family transcriptional regulator [Escherichia coli]|nr:Rha family transcriptional regulator [Escherichia coli]